MGRHVLADTIYGIVYNEINWEKIDENIGRKDSDWAEYDDYEKYEITDWFYNNNEKIKLFMYEDDIVFGIVVPFSLTKEQLLEFYKTPVQSCYYNIN